MPLAKQINVIDKEWQYNDFYLAGMFTFWKLLRLEIVPFIPINLNYPHLTYKEKTFDEASIGCEHFLRPKWLIEQKQLRSKTHLHIKSY